MGTLTLIDKAKHILRGLEIGYFDTAKDWNPSNFEAYYLYFNHPDPELRKYSLLVFAAGLGNWHMQSAFIFDPLEVQRKDPLINEDKIYILNDYVTAFINSHEAIKEEFPNLYKLIIYYFINLELSVGDDVHQVSSEVLDQLEQIIKSSGVSRTYRSGKFDFNKILRETGYL